MVILNRNRSVLGDIKSEEVIRLDCNRIQEFVGNFLNICEECSRMAAIPQGAFAACKLRSQQKNELIVSRVHSTEKQDQKKYENKKLMEYTPVKYNSKLMNSIWGLYNRYSPHNIKGNDDDVDGQRMQLQQPITIRFRLAVAAYTIADNLVMAFGAGNEWKFPAKRMS